MRSAARASASSTVLAVLTILAPPGLADLDCRSFQASRFAWAFALRSFISASFSDLEACGHCRSTWLRLFLSTVSFSVQKMQSRMPDMCVAGPLELVDHVWPPGGALRWLRCGSKPVPMKARPCLTCLRSSVFASSSSTTPAASLTMATGSAFGSSPRARASPSSRAMRSRMLWLKVGPSDTISRLN